MARVRVIDGFYDTKDEVARIVNNEFVITNKPRLDKLIKAGKVELMHELEDEPEDTETPEVK